MALRVHEGAVSARGAGDPRVLRLKRPWSRRAADLALIGGLELPLQGSFWIMGPCSAAKAMPT